MSLSWHEGWASIVCLCVVGLFYFGGDVLREMLSEDSKTKWRWGDAHRRGRVHATWGTHIVIAPVCLFIAGLSVRLILRW